MIRKIGNVVRAVRGRFITKRLHATRAAAERRMRSNAALWQTLQDYLACSNSTGGEYSDYMALYDHVRIHRPREILECGTGVSTVVIAFALRENEREFGIRGRIASMEDKEQWYRVAEELLPPDLTPYVDLILSPRVEDSWYLFRGIRYESVPDRKYDFVFVDGPDFDSLSDGKLTFDFDLIRVVEKADHPVYAIVDDRLSTSFVYQKVFGPDKACYRTTHRLCFVGPVTCHDIRGMEAQKACFIHSFRYFGVSELEIRLQPIKRTGPR